MNDPKIPARGPDGKLPTKTKAAVALAMVEGDMRAIAAHLLTSLRGRGVITATAALAARVLMYSLEQQLHEQLDKCHADDVDESRAIYLEMVRMLDDASGEVTRTRFAEIAAQQVGKRAVPGGQS